MLSSIELQKRWLAKEKKKIESGKHKYLHIDQRLMSLTEDFVRDIWMPKKVAQHPFYPFALVYERRFKYKKDPVSGKRYKTEKKPRPISYAAHYDSLIYSWYAFQLSDKYEALLHKSGISENVIAYRSFPEKKGNVEFAKEIIDFIDSHSECAILNFDIEDFFGSIDHSLLKNQWKAMLSSETGLPDDHYAIFKASTRFSQFELEKVLKILGLKSSDQKRRVRLCSPKELRKIIQENKDGLFKNNSDKKLGIPQGASISCVLSNLYMIDFDRAVAQKVKETGGLYRRYSDDIIIISQPEKIKNLEDFVLGEIKRIKLTINSDKTERHIVKWESGGAICYELVNGSMGKKSNLQYLGIEFNGQKAYLRHKGYARFQTKLSRGVRRSMFRVVFTDSEIIPKKKLYQKFGPKSDRNYLTYANRASRVLDNSKTIKQQVSSKRVYKSIKNKVRFYREKYSNIKRYKENIIE